VALDVSIPGRFATIVYVSPPDDKEILTVSHRKLHTFGQGGKIAIILAKCLGIETSKGAKRPGGELATYSEFLESTV